MDCISCGTNFSYVGQHYRQSGCTYPTLSQHQLELVEGVLMGDGLWLSADETESAFEYMGTDPVAGFDRKWVNNSE